MKTKKKETKLQELERRIRDLEVNQIRILPTIQFPFPNSDFPVYIGTGGTVKSTCLHDNCSNCHGTGKGANGVCVHGLVCPCPKHSFTC